MKGYESDFKKLPRATAKEHHDLVASNLCCNLAQIYRAKVFDEIKLFSRNGKVIYSSKKSTVSPSIVEKNILNGKWSNFEKSHLEDIIIQIREMKVKRIAPDLDEYVVRTNDLLEKIQTNYEKNNRLYFKRILYLLITIALFVSVYKLFLNCVIIRETIKTL